MRKISKCHERHVSEQLAVHSKMLQQYLLHLMLKVFVILLLNCQIIIQISALYKEEKQYQILNPV